MPNMTWNGVGHILIETFQQRIQNYEMKQDMLQEKLLWQSHFLLIKKKREKKNIVNAKKSFLLSITINPSQSMNS